MGCEVEGESVPQLEPPADDVQPAPVELEPSEMRFGRAFLAQRVTMASFGAKLHGEAPILLLESFFFCSLL